MKTIQELEAELVEVEKRESEVWVKVGVAREEYDKLSREWYPLNQQKEKLKLQIDTRKEMEAGS